MIQLEVSQPVPDAHTHEAVTHVPLSVPQNHNVIIQNVLTERFVKWVNMPSEKTSVI
jgi:hypothetical protein